MEPTLYDALCQLVCVFVIYCIAYTVYNVTAKK